MVVSLYKDRTKRIMGQKASTIEEQLYKLQQRGMDIGDKDKAQSILMDIGYYRLGFYSFPFENTYPEKGRSRKHAFRTGTRMCDVVDLYYFDFDLRSRLFSAITRIEVNFRTKLIYELSVANKENNTWFADPSVLEESYVNSFYKNYEAIYDQQEVIRRHIEKYHPRFNPKNKRAETIPYAPAWKTLEFITFGDSIRLYKAIRDKRISRKIARQYGISNLKEMLFCLNAMRDLRNACAHGQAIYDMHLRYRAVLGNALTTSSKSKVVHIGSMIEIAIYLLGQISQKRAKELRADISSLFGEQRDNPVLYNILKESTGYSL